LVSGRPIEESVARHGPIVMNTEGELEQAYAALRNGTFIKPHQQSQHLAPKPRRRDDAMSWMPAQDPVLGDNRSCDMLDLIIAPRVRDLGGGFFRAPRAAHAGR
jgi:hypothetical protein